MSLANVISLWQSFPLNIMYTITSAGRFMTSEFHIFQKRPQDREICFLILYSAEVLHEISGDMITLQRESDQNQFQENKM